MHDLAPMLVMMTLIITTGGVLLLRPITKKLGTFLEVLAEERRQALQKSATPRESADQARMLSILETMDERMTSHSTVRRPPPEFRCDSLP
jgi:hypothetical protein